MKKLVPILGLVSFVAACAQQPDKVQPTYISSSNYTGKSCNQLMEERNQVVSRVNALTKKQKTAANTDAALVGVTMVLFWPAAFAMLLTEDESNSLAEAKGEYEAITKRMSDRGCSQA